MVASQHTVVNSAAEIGLLDGKCTTSGATVIDGSAPPPVSLVGDATRYNATVVSGSVTKYRC